MDNNLKICLNKTRYLDKGYAERTAASLIKEGKAKFLRVYSCPTCAGFHLTSRESWDEVPEPTQEEIDRYYSGRRKKKK